MVSEHLSTIVRLRGLLDVTRLVRREDDLSTLLAEIAATISETLGWTTVAITVQRPAHDDFRVETVHGSEGARASLLGKTRTRDNYDMVLDARFERRGAYLIPHGDFDWDGHGLTLYVPPGDESTDPDAWHPEDALFIPLEDSQGALLGVISVDEPSSGRKPSDEELDVLVAVGSHAALAIESVRAGSEAERHRRALEHLLRLSSRLAENPGEGLLDTVCEAIGGALGFERVAVYLLDGDRFLPRATFGWALDDPGLDFGATTDELRALFVPEFEIEGCYLLTQEHAHEHVPAEHRSAFVSTRMGSGPRGWRGHWLLVPLQDAAGELRAFIWADEPEDQLVPPRERLQALRLFADQAAASLHAAEQLRAVRESEARKSAVLESALDCVITIDHQGRIVEFNPEAEETFGWTSEEAMGRELAELLVAPGRDGRRLADYLATGMAAIAGKRLEVTAVRSNGRKFPVEVAVSKVRIPGAPLYTATIRDISQRRRAEDRLRDAEAKYRTLVEQMPIVAYINELGQVPSRTRYMSPQVEKLLGYARSDWVDSDFFLNVLHPDDHARVLGEIERARDTGAPFRSEYRLVAADGRVVWVLDETMTVEDEHGTPLFLQGFLLDITERKAAEEARRQSEELYRLVVENSMETISLLDLEGRMLYVSPAIEDLLGYDASELVGTLYAQLLHPDDLGPAAETLAVAAAGGPATPQTARVKHKEGHWVHLDGTASCIVDEKGKPSMILSVARDVTERLRLEEELRQAQKMEAVGNLAGGIAHDFNNLLTAIAGYSDLICGDDEAGDSARRSAAQIARAADRASSLTRQLLAFSRKQFLQSRVLDLNDLVTDVEKMLGRIIGEHIELETRLSPSLGSVKADPNQIEQVILNLAVNARDAMPNGGTLSIATSNVEIDDVHARQHVGLEPGAYVLLAVSDTGHGIDPTVRDRIFDPFFTTKPQGKGTGLGLSTAYGIVTQSGGHIGVYSEPGSGATFKIYLPRVVEAVAAAPVPLPTELDTGTETILLVEDEEIVRGIASEILERQGYTVLAAADPDEALTFAQHYEGEIDLLLTDVVMPKMGGRDLAARVVAARPNAAVLYTSGYTDAAIVHHGVVGDGLAFLQKPFTRKVLVRRVREVLDAVVEREAATG